MVVVSTPLRISIAELDETSKCFMRRVSGASPRLTSNRVKALNGMEGTRRIAREHRINEYMQERNLSLSDKTAQPLPVWPRAKAHQCMRPLSPSIFDLLEETVPLASHR